MQSVPIPDRDEIEAAIRRVQAGELSPSEATELLLGGGQRADRGSLVELVDRLGSPPQDIADQWCNQARDVLLRLRPESAESIPAASLNDWLIDAAGRLSFRGQACETENTTSDSRELAIAVRDYMVHFRTLLSTQTAPTEEAAGRTSVETGRVLPASDDRTVKESGETRAIESRNASHDLRIEGNAESNETDAASQMAANRSDSETAESTDTTPGNRGSRWPKVVVSVLIVASLLVIASILYRASRSDVERVAKSNGQQPNVPANGSAAGFDESILDPLDSSLRDSGGTAGVDSALDSASNLMTFESTEHSADSDSGREHSPELISLDSIIPDVPMLSLDVEQPNEGSNTGQQDAESTTDVDAAGGMASATPDNSDESAMATPVGDDPLQGGGDENAPAETPQPTRIASVTAIQLPTRDDAITRRLIIQGHTAEPILDFPFDVKLRMRKQTTESRPNASTQRHEWSITDEQAGLTIANVTDAQDDCFFQWTTNAKQSPTAASLLHGRIRDAAERTIYLRPSIEADAWRIKFDRSDSRPTWDLTSIIPPRVSRISLDLVLSDASVKDDELEIGWIEPVQTTSPRRTRGLAVLTPKDGETVAVGLRFDIRCSRKLSCRVRTFGRLDPKSPWQLISRPMLDRIADQLTNQATRLSQMSTQMESLYSKSDSDQRRVLGPRRDAIEQQYDRVVIASNRVADLWALVSRIETDVDVRTRVWVQWPDSQQDLLSTSSADD